MANANRTKTAEEGYEPDWGTQPYVNIDPALLDASVDGQGGTIRNKPVFTADQAAFYLNRGDPVDPDDLSQGFIPRTGASWAGHQGNVNGIFDAIPKGYVEGQVLTELAFGFYETQASLPEPYYYVENGVRYQLYPQAGGFSAFDADQREAARDSLQAWDDLINLSFVEKDASEADINFMNTTTGPIQASAYLPYNYGPAGVTEDGNVVEQTNLAGDVFINPNQASNHQFDEGQYGLTTLIHELGHAMGLEHPGGYNFSANFTATYINGAEYYQDSLQYSIMSYWGAHETGAAHINWNNLSFIYASTPMVHDILAIQRIYGADMTTRTGNTTYGFNSNADRDAFDFEATPMPVVAIWDAGGEDTLDFSGWNSNSTINLNPGSFSSGGGSGYIPLDVLKARGVLPASYTEANYAALLARYNSPDGLLHDNIAIAYGAWIENAVGGGGNDLIIANDVANKISGGAGSDTVSYEASDEGVRVQLVNEGRGSWFNVTGGGYAAGDKLDSIENVIGSDFNDALLGNRQDNSLDGGAGNDIVNGDDGDDTLKGGDGIDVLNAGDGEDVLLGGAGADILSGGDNADILDGGADNDYLLGGHGRDVFTFSDLGGKDRVGDFKKGEDKIDVSNIDAIAGNAGHDAFSWIGKNAFSNTAGELRSYKDRGTTYLEGDVNGDGVADFVVTFQGQAPLVTDIIFA